MKSPTALIPTSDLSESRMLLLGAVFTNEYAIEGAALCNPSMVAHPDQTGTAAGSLRFVMSVRGIGEGHRSSIGFRTGVVDEAGDVTVDDPAPFASVGAVVPTLLDGAVMRRELGRLRGAGEAADYVLDALGDQFTRADLDEQLDKLQTHRRTRGHATATISLIRTIAERTYGVEFADDSPLSERVLCPAMSAEAAGMEDARFVRFVDDDGSVTFYASYTAYSGSHISQQLLETEDFRSFTSTPMVGPGRGQQGPGTVSPPDSRALRGHVADRTVNRIRLRTRIIRSSGPTRFAASGRFEPGRRCNSGTVVRPSKPRPGGWCSPTASARCAPTASGRCCSISRIRHGFSVSSASRC